MLEHLEISPSLGNSAASLIILDFPFPRSNCFSEAIAFGTPFARNVGGNRAGMLIRAEMEAAPSPIIHTGPVNSRPVHSHERSNTRMRFPKKTPLKDCAGCWMLFAGRCLELNKLYTRGDIPREEIHFQILVEKWSICHWRIIAVNLNVEKCGLCLLLYPIRDGRFSLGLAGITIDC